MGPRLRVFSLCHSHRLLQGLRLTEASEGVPRLFAVLAHPDRGSSCFFLLSAASQHDIHGNVFDSPTVHSVLTHLQSYREIAP